MKLSPPLAITGIIAASLLLSGCGEPVKETKVHLKGSDATVVINGFTLQEYNRYNRAKWLAVGTPTDGYIDLVCKLVSDKGVLLDVATDVVFGIPNSGHLLFTPVRIEPSHLECTMGSA